MSEKQRSEERKIENLNSKDLADFLVYEIDVLRDPELNKSIKDRANNLLQTTIYEKYKELESLESGENDVFTEEELQDLEILNTKLVGEKQTFSKIVDDLINKQEKLMRDRGVDEEIISVEIQHIKDVVGFSQSLMPENIILHLTASVHDSMKRITGRYTELGLHEVASTILGPKLVEEAVRKYFPKGDTNLISEKEMKLMKKMIERAIFTHGTEEWPEINSVQIADTEIYSLKNYWLYLKTNERRADNINIATILKNPMLLTIIAMNVADKLAGTNVTSLQKYNNDSRDIDMLNANLVTNYINEVIFSSFGYNLNNHSIDILLQTLPEEEKKKLKQYIENRITFKIVVSYFFGAFDFNADKSAGTVEQLQSLGMNNEQIEDFKKLIIADSEQTLEDIFASLKLTQDQMNFLTKIYSLGISNKFFMDIGSIKTSDKELTINLPTKKIDIDFIIEFMGIIDVERIDYLKMKIPQIFEATRSLGDRFTKLNNQNELIDADKIRLIKEALTNFLEIIESNMNDGKKPLNILSPTPQNNPSQKD